MRFRAAAQRALSFGELLVASGLLAVMLVTLMVLFGQMLGSTTKSGLVSQAIFLADRVIEAEIYRLQSASVLNPPPREGSELLYSQDDQLKQEFVYSIDADYGASDGPAGRLYSIDVTVKWWISLDQVRHVQENRTGMGRLSITRNRLVYVQKIL